MKDRPTTIVDIDLERLERILWYNDATPDKDKKHLLKRLDGSPPFTVVSSKKVPPKVVVMESMATIQDLDTKETFTLTLVFPQDADAKENRISVLAPIGAALLGHRVGDVVEWEAPSRLRRFKVTGVAPKN